MDLARALLFLYRMLGAPNRTPGMPTVLETSEGPIEADLYTPRRPWATVLALHGLALRAHRDPRLVGVARALQAVGVLVVAPRIAPMAELRLSPPPWQIIAACFRALRDREDLGAPARVGVFGPSYAGGQALRAAAEPDLQDMASGMMLIGAYADARGLMAHLLDSDEADPYGRLILVRHFLEETAQLTPGVAQAIEANLADLGLDTETLPGVLEAIDAADRDHFLGLRDQRAIRQALGETILAEHAEAIDDLSVLLALDAVQAPVTLLHGAHDPVIPPSESERIREELLRTGRRCPLVTTALLDHGNVMAKGQALLQVPTVVGAFAHWLRTLRRHR